MVVAYRPGGLGAFAVLPKAGVRRDPEQAAANAPVNRPRTVLRDHHLRPGGRDLGGETPHLVGVSIPSFFLGILLFLLFGLWLGWLPVQGYVPMRESITDNLRHLILPTVALGVARTAILTRL